MELREILNHYAGPAVGVLGDASDDFQQIARHTSVKSLRDALAIAFRSTDTAGFGQIIGILFEQSNPVLKAALLNEIVLAIGPAAALSAAGGILGRLLRAGPVIPISPVIAVQLSATHASVLVSTARQRDASVVDRLAAFYSQHCEPTNKGGLAG